MRRLTGVALMTSFFPTDAMMECSLAVGKRNLKGCGSQMMIRNPL
jgi:hypothetical protein